MFLVVTWNVMLSVCSNLHTGVLHVTKRLIDLDMDIHPLPVASFISQHMCIRSYYYVIMYFFFFSNLAAAAAAYSEQMQQQQPSYDYSSYGSYGSYSTTQGILQLLVIYWL